MEAIIGTVAVIFVTTMIVWMRKHAKDLKGELEAEATAAAGRGTAWALAGMAFLAVLKEGFETSRLPPRDLPGRVEHGPRRARRPHRRLGRRRHRHRPLHAAASASISRSSSPAPASSSSFVAAGLVSRRSARRTRRAGSLIGQQRTVDLAGSRRTARCAAPSSPGCSASSPTRASSRCSAGSAYLVPVLAHRGLAPCLAAVAPAACRQSARSSPRAPSPSRRSRWRSACTPRRRRRPSRRRRSAQDRRTARPPRTSPRRVPLFASAAHTCATVTFPASSRTRLVRTTASRPTAARHEPKRAATAQRPATVTLDRPGHALRADPRRHLVRRPARPVRAEWAEKQTTTLWTVDGGVLDTKRTRRDRADAPAAASRPRAPTRSTRPAGRCPPRQSQRVASSISSSATTASELRLWNTWLPLALGDRRRCGRPSSLSATVGAVRPSRRPPRPLSPPPTLPTLPRRRATLQGARPMPFGDPQRSRRSTRTTSVLAIGALAVSTALALAGCSTSSTAGSGDTTTSSKGVHKVDVQLTGGGSDKCAVSATSVPAGPVTFSVTNKSSTGITEVELLQDQRILGEKENLAPGLGTETFTVTLGGGKYQVYCPGATKELTDLHRHRQGGQGVQQLGRHPPRPGRQAVRDLRRRPGHHHGRRRPRRFRSRSTRAISPAPRRPTPRRAPTTSASRATSTAS